MKTNIIQFSQNSKMRLASQYWYFCQRANEMSHGLCHFDRERFSEEYMFLEDEYLEIHKRIDYVLEELRKTDIEIWELNLIYESVNSLKVQNYWWYNYLTEDGIKQLNC